MKQKNVILMVVAVGCGLVAAILTARMNAAPPPAEKVMVIVPAKDITVGTMITKEDVANGKMFTHKEFLKDAIPPNIVDSDEQLIDRRVARNYSAGEPIKVEDLKKGAVVTIPPGHQMIAQSFGIPQAVAGFVTPGSRVDVLGTVHLGNKYKAFPVLVNMLILAVDNNTQLPQDKGTFTSLSTVSFAVDQKQALVLQLARSRGCELTLLLRNPNEPVTDGDKNFKIDDVINRLSDSRDTPEVTPSDEEKSKKKDPENKPETVAPAPILKIETIRILVATEAIPAGTEITADLIAEKFKEKEFRKDDVDNALDPNKKIGLAFTNGLGKGQWVTGDLIGEPLTKASPRNEFVAPKPEPGDTRPDVKPEPMVTKVPDPVKPTKPKYQDTRVHTTGGTVIYRYEEVKPGQWKYLGVISSDNATDEEGSSKPAPNN
jgi:Flp pilus assembly protein CpaB